jgi:hypothetical protein
MTKESHKFLTNLLQAKEEVKRLETEYRKICECNEKLPGVDKISDKSFYYRKLYKTCSYHEVRLTRSA